MQLLRLFMATDQQGDLPSWRPIYKFVDRIWHLRWCCLGNTSRSCMMAHMDPRGSFRHILLSLQPMFEEPFFNLTCFIVVMFGVVGFFRVAKHCSSLYGHGLIGLEGWRMMGNLKQSSISTIVSWHLMASTCTWHKSQLKITEVASFSANEKVNSLRTRGNLNNELNNP